MEALSRYLKNVRGSIIHPTNPTHRTPPTPPGTVCAERRGTNASGSGSGG